MPKLVTKLATSSLRHEAKAKARKIHGKIRVELDKLWEYAGTLGRFVRVFWRFSQEKWEQSEFPVDLFLLKTDICDGTW